MLTPRVLRASAASAGDEGGPGGEERGQLPPATGSPCGNGQFHLTYWRRREGGEEGGREGGREGGKERGREGERE